MTEKYALKHNLELMQGIILNGESTYFIENKYLQL